MKCHPKISPTKIKSDHFLEQKILFHTNKNNENTCNRVCKIQYLKNRFWFNASEGPVSSINPIPTNIFWPCNYWRGCDLYCSYRISRFSARNFTFISFFVRLRTSVLFFLCFLGFCEFQCPFYENNCFLTFLWEYFTSFWFGWS